MTEETTEKTETTEPTKQIAIVSGGSRGIGRATAVQLAEDGWDVAILYHGHDEPANMTVQMIEAVGGRGWAVKCDVSDEDQVRDAIRTIGSYGQIGGLVANAGITHDNYALMMSATTWNEVIQTNLTGTFLVCREAIRKMRKTGGAVVITSSVSGLKGSPGQANYSASKGGLISLTRTLAMECLHMKIPVRVNSVAPGFTNTDMVRFVPNEMFSKIPMGRLAEPAEIAAVIAFMLSPGSSYITGQTLAVDGGLTC